jgi:hypothetical protein
MGCARTPSLAGPLDARIGLLIFAVASLPMLPYGLMGIRPAEPGRPTTETFNERLKTRTTFAGRYLTADLRPLPNFVIVGAQRGGTTSLYRWLSSHPGVTPALKKEVHYFDIHYAEGIRWYRAHFPLKRKGQITGEASPYMLFHPLAPERAAKDLPPETKFIVLLREPVQRAISQYWLSRRMKQWENEPLEEAIDLEPQRLSGEFERVLRGESSPKHQTYSYTARGEYAQQLRRWFDAVGRERILILESEKLYSDPATTDRVLEFLELAPYATRFPKSNRADRLDFDNGEVVARLKQHFEPHNRELFELLGYEMWTDPVPPRPTGRAAK